MRRTQAHESRTVHACTAVVLSSYNPRFSHGRMRALTLPERQEGSLRASLANVAPKRSCDSILIQSIYIGVLKLTRLLTSFNLITNSERQHAAISKISYPFKSNRINCPQKHSPALRVLKAIDSILCIFESFWIHLKHPQTMKICVIARSCLRLRVFSQTNRKSESTMQIHQTLKGIKIL